MICPPGKSMSFNKKETEKIELVERPGNSSRRFTSRFKCFKLIYYEIFFQARTNSFQSKLGMKKSLHRKKLVLAISSKQELANAQAQAGQDGQPTVVDAAGKLDHYWVTRW